MCDRYSITTNPEAMRRLFKFKNATPNLQPNYNAAPTQRLPVPNQPAGNFLKDGGRLRFLISIAAAARIRSCRSSSMILAASIG